MTATETDTRHWLIIIPHYWARGATRKEAIEKLCSIAGRRSVISARSKDLSKRMPYAVYRYPEHAKAYVNDMGDIGWATRDAKDPDKDKPELVESNKLKG